MRHLIVCRDGTWNTPEEEAATNVARLHSALAGLLDTPLGRGLGSRVDQPCPRRATRRRREHPHTVGDSVAHSVGTVLRTALTVAVGATNKKADATPFLSVKTIETHLSRIYRKLGLRPLAELARTLSS